MATVLVVSRSLDDQKLMGELLGKNPAWNVEHVEEGAQALEALEREPAGIVLIESQIPKIEGGEVLALMRERYPRVPVVVITPRGVDEAVVRALLLGAATYLPKSSLARDLVNTVERVLNLSGWQRRHAGLLECLVSGECTFDMGNERRLVPVLVGYLQDCMEQFNLCGGADLVRVGIALEEALINALVHGNLEIDSATRDQGWAEYERAIEERGRLEPYAQRRIHVRARFLPSQAEFVIRDGGQGFDVEAVPDPTLPENIGKASGRGLLLMRSFMDEVAYNSTGNEVTLIKRNPAARGTA